MNNNNNIEITTQWAGCVNTTDDTNREKKYKYNVLVCFSKYFEKKNNNKIEWREMYRIWQTRKNRQVRWWCVSVWCVVTTIPGLHSYDGWKTGCHVDGKFHGLVVDQKRLVVIETAERTASLVSFYYFIHDFIFYTLTYIQNFWSVYIIYIFFHRIPDHNKTTGCSSKK